MIKEHTPNKANRIEEQPPLDIRKRKGPDGYIPATAWARKRGHSRQAAYQWMATGRLSYIRRNGRYWVEIGAEVAPSKRSKERGS